MNYLGYLDTWSIFDFTGWYLFVSLFFFVLRDELYKSRTRRNSEEHS